MEQDQLITLCEIFKILVRDDVTMILRKMNVPISEYTVLSGISKNIASQKPNFLISKNLNIIESVILEKLELPGVEFYDFLLSSLITTKAKHSQSYSNDVETPKILGEITMVIKNYLALSLTSPEFFEGKNMSVKFSNLFQTVNYSDPKNTKTRLTLQLLNELRDDAFRDEIFDSFNDDANFKVVIFLAFKTELDKLIMFNQQIFDYLDLFTHLNGNTSFRNFVTNNFAKRDFANGKEFEKNTFLSIFLSKSILPMPQDPLISEYAKTAVDRVKSCKSQSAYNKTCQVR